MVDIYAENYKILLRKDEDLNKWRYIYICMHTHIYMPCSWIRRVNFVKMSVQPKWNSTVNKIPMKIYRKWQTDLKI